VAFVEEVLLEEPRERPPDALDVVFVVGDIGVAKIEPVPHLLRHPLPLLGVAEDGRHAALNERLDSVGLDVRLAVDPELLLDLDLNRKPVRVPARFARSVEAAHRPIAREDVLEDPRQDVAVMGLSVRRRGPVVPDEARSAAAPLDAFLEDAVLFPKGADRFLGFREVDDGLRLQKTGGSGHRRLS
jgi:hypothetical protein